MHGYYSLITGSRSLHADFPKMKNVSSLRLRGSQSKILLAQIAKKPEKTGSSRNQWNWRGSCKTPKPENLENSHYKNQTNAFNFLRDWPFASSPFFSLFNFFIFFLFSKIFHFSLQTKLPMGFRTNFHCLLSSVKRQKKIKLEKTFSLS